MVSPDGLADALKKLSLDEQNRSLDVPRTVLTDPNGNPAGTGQEDYYKRFDCSSSEEDPIELEERLKGQLFLEQEEKKSRFSITKVDGEEEFEGPDAEYWAWRGARRPSMMELRVEKANRTWNKMEGGDGKRSRRVTFSGETEKEVEEVPQFRPRLSSVSIPRDRHRRLADFCRRSKENNASGHEEEKAAARFKIQDVYFSSSSSDEPESGGEEQVPCTSSRTF